MADIQRQQQTTDMTIKPVSHNDDEAFIAMLRQFAKRAMAAGDEEMEFVLSAAANKLEEYKERYEALQADFERAEKAWDKEMSDR